MERNQKEHITEGVRILVNMMSQVNNYGRRNGWSLENRTKGGIAAYNAGSGNIRVFYHFFKFYYDFKDN